MIARFEVLTAVTMKNGVFCDVTPCDSCKNRRFGGAYRVFHQGDKNRWTRNNARSVHRLLVIASLVPSPSIPVTLMKEALSSSETSVITRGTQRNIPEDVILHSHRRGYLSSYIYWHCCKQGWIPRSRSVAHDAPRSSGNTVAFAVEFHWTIIMEDLSDPEPLNSRHPSLRWSQ
jgi:hypothetical protein